MIYLVTYIQLFVFEQACTLFVKFTALSICLSFICYIFTRHQLVGTVFFGTLCVGSVCPSVRRSMDPFVRPAKSTYFK